MSNEKEEILDEETKEDLKEEIKEELKKEAEVKKHPFMITVMIIVLLCVFMGIGYALGGVTTVHDVKNTNVGNNKVNSTTKAKDDSFKEVELDSQIKNLWSRVQLNNLLSVTKKSLVDYVGMKVSDMSDDVKGMYAAAYYERNYNVSYGRDYISEDTVRYAYDSIFGAGSYKTGQDIYTSCAPYTYEADNHRYKAGEGGCGGASTYALLEVPYKAEMNGNQLKVYSSIGFYNYGQKKLYKTKDIEESNVIEGFEGSDVEAKEFIKNNASKLANYAYTFELDSNNFYKFVGYSILKK